MNTRETERIVWVDCLKGFVIILMVLGHCIQFGSGNDYYSAGMYFCDTVFRLIYSFHMPCLMLIAGAFFSGTVEKKDFWRNLLIRTVIPLMIWSAVPVIIETVKALCYKRFSFPVVRDLSMIFLKYYWFLWALLIMSVTVRIVHGFFNDNLALYIILGAVILLLPDVLNTELYKFMYPFFVIGYLFNRKKRDLSDILKYRVFWIPGLIALYILLFIFFDTETFVYISGTCIRTFRQLLIDAHRYAIGLIGSLIAVCLARFSFPYINKYFPSCVRLLSYFGRISLLIYLIDILIDSFLLPVITYSFRPGYPTAFLETSLILLLCAVIGAFIGKVSLLNRLLLGGRT